MTFLHLPWRAFRLLAIAIIAIQTEISLVVDAQAVEDQSLFFSGCENLDGQYVCVSYSTPSDTLAAAAANNTATCSVLISNQACSSCEPCTTEDGNYGVETECDNVNAQFTTATDECKVFVNFSGAESRIGPMGTLSLALLASGLFVVW